MKKVFLMFVMMALPFAMQAQTKFHDVEANEAKGAVKMMTQSVMGNNIVVNFSKEGKMERQGLSDVVYDADGYIQSAKMEAQGMQLAVSFKWENGRLLSQTANVMGQEMVTTYTYNEQGAPASNVINMGGQEMTSTYTDYKYDDHGNWISRKTSIMGQDIEQTRTLEYYE